MEKNKSIAPAFTLMVLAPLLAEVLPGATRFSSLFVFPIEICVWGGGALLIRYVVRRWQLGWINMLFLALALSLAEEFLIQQTSVAPMLIQLKGITYARAFGINYVYLLWALIYESVFVIFIPVYLTELIFPDRRHEPWIGKHGITAVCLLFLLGSFLAWYTWTQIARPTVFHVQPYNPSFIKICIAIVLIVALILAATRLFRNKPLYKIPLLNPPSYWIVAAAGGLWAVLLYGIVVLAFGDWPSFPPLIAIGAGLLLAIAAIRLVSSWTISARWEDRYLFVLIFGIMLGAMSIGFIGFIGAAPMDLYFKILLNVLFVIFMIVLCSRIKKRVR